MSAQPRVTTPDAKNIPSPAARYLDALGTIACIALALATLGFAAFRFANTLPPGASRNQDRAFFTTVNAFTLTGFAQTSAAVPDVPPLGLATIGLMASGGAMVSLVGGGYFLSAAFGIRVRLTTLIAMSAAILFGPAMAAWAWNGFDALSATTGLGLLSSRWPGDAARTMLVTLSVPGMIGTATLIGVCSARRTTGDPRSYLLLSVAAIAVAYTLGVYLMLATSTTTWLDASLASLNLRGLGLAQRLDRSSASPWATMLLMLIGGGPASTAGGLGTLPLVIVGRGVIDVLRGRSVDRMLGVAMVWIVALFGTIAALVLSLAAVEPSVGGERLLLLAVGAVTNVGITHDPVGITGGGLFILSGGMLVGRMLPLAMLCWLAIVAALPAAPVTAAVAD